MKRARRAKKVHTARIIPERGSWLELEVSSKEVLQMRIDKSGKLPATALLRALSGENGDTKTLLKKFYDMVEVDFNTLAEIDAEKIQLKN